jgi:acyl-CoA thioesterase YciA
MPPEAHAPKDAKDNIAPRVMPAAEPVLRTIAMPADTNPSGDIFGGWIMSQMDMAAGNAASRLSKGRCATVAVEKMSFLSPVHIGDEVTVWATLIRRGRTSMTFDVECWRRPRDGEFCACVTHALFTFVALDRAGRPRELPAADTNETWV